MVREIGSLTEPPGGPTGQRRPATDACSLGAFAWTGAGWVRTEEGCTLGRLGAWGGGRAKVRSGKRMGAVEELAEHRKPALTTSESQYWPLLSVAGDAQGGLYCPTCVVMTPHTQSPPQVPGNLPLPTCF